MREALIIMLILLAVILATQGCAAIGLVLVGTGAGIAGGTGTSYTLDGITYRTFTAPIDDLRTATLRTLRRMDMAVKTDEVSEQGRAVIAAAGDRTIHIDLEKLTSRTTRMRVTAKQGWFFRDRATATEIIAQTGNALDDMPALSQKMR